MGFKRVCNDPARCTFIVSINKSCFKQASKCAAERAIKQSCKHASKHAYKLQPSGHVRVQLHFTAPMSCKHISREASKQARKQGTPSGTASAKSLYSTLYECKYLDPHKHANKNLCHCNISQVDVHETSATTTVLQQRMHGQPFRIGGFCAASEMKNASCLFHMCFFSLVCPVAH